MNVDKPAHTSGMYGVSLSEELELQQEVLRSVWVGRLDFWPSLPHNLFAFFWYKGISNHATPTVQNSVTL